MLTFFILAVVLTALILSLILLPLLRPGPRPAPPGEAPGDAQMALYQARRREIAQEAEGPEARQALEAEWDREVLAGMADVVAVDRRPGTAGTGRLPRRAALLCLIAVPLIAGGVYALLGRPELIAASPSQANEISAGTMADVIVKLKARLELHPTDLEGWLLLGRTFDTLKRPAEAAETYTRALALRPEAPEIRLALAEALAKRQGGRFAGEPARLIALVLEKHPEEPLGLWLAGWVAAEAGKKEDALAAWHKLQGLLPSDDPRTAEIRAFVAEATSGAAASGGAVAGTAAPGGGASGAAIARPEPVEGLKGGPATSGRDFRLTVAVRLAAAPPRPLGAGETVFVLLKDAEGPPAPLAVLRRPASSLPFTVEISDQDALQPDRLPSAARRPIVVARTSLTGEARPQRGDLAAEAAPVQPGEGRYDLVLDRQLP